MKEVFNPYDQLGINKMAPLAEIQLKLKAKKRIINEELKQIEGGSNLPAVYEDRLGVWSYRFISSELTFIRHPFKQNLKTFFKPSKRLVQLQKDLETIEKSTEIFATSESRRKFNNEYELKVHKIINRNLSFKQKLSLRTTKTYQYALDTLRPKVPSPVRTGKKEKFKGLNHDLTTPFWSSYY